MARDLTIAMRGISALLGREGGTEGGVGVVKNDEGLITLLRRLHERAQTDRREHEHTWGQNIAHAMGHQHADWSGGMLKLNSAPSWRVRHTVNLVGTSLQRNVASLTHMRPHPEVIPKSTQHKDRASAELCENVLEAKYDEAKTQRRIKEWILKASIYGKAYKKVWFNPDLGQQTTEEGEDGEVERYFDGDVDYSIDDPMSFYYDPDADYLCDARWCMSTQMRTRGWAIEAFPKKYDDLIESVATDEPTGLWHWLKTLLSGSTGKHGSDYMLVTEFWMKPKRGEKDPWKRDGFFCVIINRVLVKFSKFPYAHGRLPWVEMTDAFLPGLAKYPPTLVAQWLPMQHMYNDLEGVLKENLDVFARPKWMARRGANIDEDAITSEPGEVIFYDGEVPPQPVMPRDPNPQSYISLLDRTRGDLEDVAGQHEPSRGVSPGANAPAYAIELLQQADNKTLQPQADDLRLSLIESMRMTLELYRQFSENDERTAILYRGNKQYKTFTFTGAKLSYRDLRIEPNSMKPTSPMAHRQQILQMAGVKLFGPYESPAHEQSCKKVLRTLQWGNFGDIFDEATKDIERIDWENSQMDLVEEGTPRIDPMTGAPMQDMNGQVIIEPVCDIRVNPSDDDDEHIKGHEMRQKDLSFNDLLPIAQRVQLEHVEAHKQAKVMKQMELEQIAAGLFEGGHAEPTNPQQAAMGMPDLNREVAMGGPMGTAAPTAGSDEGPTPEAGQPMEPPVSI